MDVTTSGSGSAPRRARRAAGRRWLVIPLVLAVLAAGCTGEGPDQGNEAGETQEDEDEDGDEGVAEGGSGELADEQVLNVFAFFEPPSWDPARQGPATFGGNGLRRQYTEALLKPEADVEDPGVTTAAAEDFEVSDDGLVYTFDLRDEGAYNDGEPVTASDFVFAWQRLIDPRVPSPMGGLFSVVEGAEEVAAMGTEASDPELDEALAELGLEAVDEDTFEVTLAHPAPYFEWVAAETAGAPVREDVVAEHGADEWATSPDTLTTNGPFQLAETGENEVVFEPNPHYAGEEPTLERLVAGFGLGPAPRWTEYENDELDISNGPPPESFEAALNDPEYEDEIMRFPELSTQWLGFNTDAAPFDDLRARLAVTKAIDRDAYNEVGADTGFPAASLVPEGMPGHNPEVDAQAFDPEAAQQLLDEAGVDAGDFEGVTLLTAPPQETNALFIADQLSEHLGVEVEVDSVGESAVRDSRLQEGDYHMRQTFIGHAANYPDPQDFFDVFLSDSRDNQPGWESQEYDELVREADRTTDMDARLELYDQAHEILAEEAPVAFLVQLERVFWVKPWVSGITRTPIDTAFWPGDLYSTRVEIREH